MTLHPTVPGATVEIWPLRSGIHIEFFPYPRTQVPARTHGTYHFCINTPASHPMSARGNPEMTITHATAVVRNLWYSPQPLVEEMKMVFLP